MDELKILDVSSLFEQVFDVPKIISQDYIPQRRAVVPTPSHSTTRETRVILARYLDAAGNIWFHCAGPREGLLVEAGTLVTQCPPFRREPPSAQGGVQVLGAAPVPQIQEQIVDKVVDVPVIMQLKFQQSLPIDSEMVRTHSANCAADRRFHGAVPSGRRSCERQRQDPTVHFGNLCRKPSIFHR